jgi:hypothetical protein
VRHVGNGNVAEWNAGHAAPHSFGVFMRDGEVIAVIPAKAGSAPQPKIRYP